MKSLLLTLVAASCISLIRCNVMEQLRGDPDLSQFYTLLERDPIAHATVSLRAVTVFVPTNEAFQRKTTNETYVLYHISTVALTRDQLPKSVPSDLDGNPPLYITRNRNGDLYVNNARIVPSRTMQTVVDEKHPDKKQMIHVIEDVLEPLTLLPTSLTSIEISNPDAYQFLNHADSMKIGHFRLRSYRSQVTLMKKESLYQSPGGHTFLIPIDEGFKIAARSNLVDSKVIDGHVLPNNVIFTAAAHLEVPQTTAAFEDNMKVTVSFFQQKDGKMYVKSNTMVTPDSKYPEGVVLAEIVQGNIPVRNGVVHLIHRPLMIVDTTVTQYIESFKNTDNGTLYKFYEVIMDLGGQVLDDIKGLGAVTILAPSNEAWNHSNVNNVIRNREKMREILNMHIIKGAVNVTHIRERNKNAYSHVQTVNNKTFLYFNINSDGNGNETITVEGGGVNATLIHPNLIQKNGYVHIIDRVLGVPYTTVLGKLSTDPMLNSTFFLGRDSGFNDQLNNSARRYTFFVPRDKAWMKTEVEYPSAHKKLFMRSFAYHARSILERHLVIADRTYTMQDLVAMSSDSIVLPTLRDSLKIRVIEESGGRYSIYWNLKKITVYRPDVECTNGIIHVIDAPFLEEKDIRVNGGILRAQFQISALVSILLAKILLL